MDVRRWVRGGTTVVQPVGDVDALSAMRFRSALVDAERSAALLVDLTEVEFLDAVGLRVLAAGIRRVHRRGGQLAIACPAGSVRRVLALTAVDRVVPVQPTVAAATSAMSGPVAEAHVTGVDVIDERSRRRRRVIRRAGRRSMAPAR